MEKYTYKVDPSLYTEEYFLDDSYGGAINYKEGMNRLCDPVDYIFNKIEATTENLRLLDAGCGKGELMYFCKRKGYEVFGVDYSKAAVKMSKDLLKLKFDNFEESNIVQSDVRSIPFPSNYFDVVVSTDLIEHLDDNEAAVAFIDEIYRALKPGGVFYLHTAPNKLYVDYFQTFYQRYVDFALLHIFNLFLPKKRVDVSMEVRSEYNKIVHVNEQTFFSLRKNLKKSKFNKFTVDVIANPFSFNLWKLPFYVASYLFPFSKVFPLNIFLGNHLYFKARK